MSTMISRFWSEEDGAIVSAEIVLVASILVLGMIVGLAALRDAVVTELADVAQAIANVDQSFSFASVTGHHSFTGGGVFNDTPDFCDGTDQNCTGPINSKCVVICSNPVHPTGNGADGGLANNGGGI
jgi:Flp pilus assembly pilin Flp